MYVDCVMTFNTVGEIKRLMMFDMISPDSITRGLVCWRKKVVAKKHKEFHSQLTTMIESCSKNEWEFIVQLGHYIWRYSMCVHVKVFPEISHVRPSEDNFTISIIVGRHLHCVV